MTREERDRWEAERCQRYFEWRLGPAWKVLVRGAVINAVEHGLDLNARLPSGILFGNSPRIVAQVAAVDLSTHGVPLMPPTHPPIKRVWTLK